MKLIWKKAYETGISHIDKQHKKFLVLVNDLYDIVEKEEDLRNFKDFLSRFNEYAEYHFKTEEKLFADHEYNDDDTELHLRKHEEFYKKIDRLKKENFLPLDIAAHRLADFSRKWLIDHILIYDLRYAKFIREKISNNK